jgi:hypothetical protein
MRKPQDFSNIAPIHDARVNGHVITDCLHKRLNVNIHIANSLPNLSITPAGREQRAIRRR